jgi:hypothetical protein
LPLKNWINPGSADLFACFGIRKKLQLALEVGYSTKRFRKSFTKKRQKTKIYSAKLRSMIFDFFQKGTLRNKHIFTLQLLQLGMLFFHWPGSYKCSTENAK